MKHLFSNNWAPPPIRSRSTSIGAGASCAVILKGDDVPVLRQWTGEQEAPGQEVSFDDVERQTVIRLASAGDVIIWAPTRDHSGYKSPNRIFTHLYEEGVPFQKHELYTVGKSNPQFETPFFKTCFFPVMMEEKKNP